MENNKPNPKQSPRAPKHRGRACLAAFLATMLAGPAAAEIDIPDDPLTSGARVAPNILFILDDSGSMAFDAMPDDSIGSDWSNRTYVYNAVYYDPSKIYQPWMGADGNRLSGGTDFNSVYGSFNLASGDTIDLANRYDCEEYDRNGSDRDVCGGLGTATYYVPKNLSNPGSSLSDYYRYRIHSDGAVIRSERGPRVGSNWPYNRGLDDRGCSTDWGDDEWRNCTRMTPPNPGRSEAAEVTNFATWFSYYRTRMKAAKAGASEAFGTLDGSVRVGYRSIHNRSGFDIPVTDGNDGRFVDNEDNPDTTEDESTSSRSTWYARLHSAVGNSGTPLLPALERAGEYFSGDGRTGPYGPQRGQDQLTCRQNFAILTTDGYWNSGSVSIGNVDGNDGTEITGPNDQSYTYEATAPYQDSYRNTLADVAMHYWSRDLRTDMTNNVPTKPGENPAFWQHMVTFGISIGLSGTRGWSSVDEVPADATWRDPTDREDSDRIDDLLHAAVNGRGTFVAATNPSEFATGLSEALATIARRTSSASNVAANSVSLDTGAQVFSASYVAGIWTGSLAATAVSTDGVADTPDWTASVPAWGSRQIFTSNGGSGASFPTATQVTSLARGGGPANFEVTGTDNANYIKGEQRLEASHDGTLRDRTSLIGDIINSSPAYVRDTDTIYVGANDGMLHAFDADDGEELFAFVPGIIDFNALSTLSRGDYAGQHRFFVDGPVTVSSRNLTPGENILVGTLGRGGKGVYALDVSNPDSFGASDFKWELAETPGNNMGLVLGKPILSRVHGNTNAAVLLGNGVNSTSEQAALLILDAETGGVIQEISTGVGSTAQPNGLFTPTGIYGPDGRTLAFVYAGDMLGNVWKFDLTNEAPGSWTVERIFTAVDDDGNAQPITAGLAVAIHPVTNDRWLFFGTGRYLTVEDASSENVSVQSMYGFIDDGTIDPDAPVSRGDLTERTVAVVEGGRRAFETRTSLPTGSQGWYIDLPDSGERIVQDAQVVSTFLVTASMMPSGNACDAGGSGYINALNAFTGTSAGGSYFDTDGDGDTSDETIGDLPIGSINLGVGMPTLPNLLRGLLVGGGSGGGSPEDEETLAPRWDRASWREIRGN